MRIIPGTDIWIPDGDRHFSALNPKDPKKRPVAVDYQAKLLHAAFKHVKQWRTALDIGAHVGLLARHMASRFESVLAYEPDLDNYACLLANTKKYPQIQAYPQAVGNHNGWGALQQGQPGNSGDRWLASGNDVEIIKLDDQPIMNVDFMKIDVQGAELHVLEGARKLLERDWPVILLEDEEPAKLAPRYRSLARKSQAFLEYCGYELQDTLGVNLIFTAGAAV